MRIVVTGSSSGIGAACAKLLLDNGSSVIGVDKVGGIFDGTDTFAQVTGDLATPATRKVAIQEIEERSTGRLDGVVTCAGMAGLPNRPGSLLASLNFFGTTVLIEGLRHLLVGHPSAVVAISSNSTTIQPGVPEDVIAACLSGDEPLARSCAEAAGSLETYPATKIAVAHWIRQKAVLKTWIGSTVCLNAIAPGLIETPLAVEQREDEFVGPLIEMFPIPVGRSGTAEEIAQFVNFLLGPNGRFFCGSVLFCDGGSDALLRATDWPSAWKL